MKFNGVMLGTDDSKLLGEFYTKVLGDPVWNQDDWYGWGEGGSLAIGPHSEVSGQSQNPQRIMLSFVVDDVKAEADRLKEIGAKVVAEPYLPDEKGSPDMWLATFADPDGNYLQISRPWEG